MDTTLSMVKDEACWKMYKTCLLSIWCFISENQKIEMVTKLKLNTQNYDTFKLRISNINLCFVLH